MGTTQAIDVTTPFEREIAWDLVRRAAIVTPIVLLVGGLWAGGEGVLSAAIGLVLVAANFLVSARVISWTARRSAGAVMGVVLGSYLLRMAVLFGIALLLGQLSWIDLPVLVVTIAVVHLALLVWETRYVSLSLAAPGLKPGRPEK
ncbi:MAG TPA: ATP synthase subunit I [Acidimicrobiia bacterium]|nr:ATP synthase subunit I [Acidimicrobiia bacterium]